MTLTLMNVVELLYEGENYRYLPEKSIYQTDARIFHRGGFYYDPLVRVESVVEDGASGLIAAGVLRSGERAWLSVAGVADGVLRLRFWQDRAHFQETSAMVPALPALAPPASLILGRRAAQLRVGEYRVRLGLDPFTLTVLGADGRAVLDLETEQVAGDFVAPPLGFRRFGDRGEPFLSWKIENDDRFFGLGEKFNKVEKSSTRATIWSADAGGTNSTDLSCKSVPVLYCSAGWGLLLHSSFRSLWEIGTFSYTAGSLLTEEPQLDLFVLLAPEIKGLLKRYGDLAGRPAPPPTWALGLWMSHCGYRDRPQVEELLARLRAEHIPCDVVHLDSPWQKTRYGPIAGADACDFEWDEAAWPEPRAMLADWRERGFDACLWINPYLPEGTPIYDEALRAGFLAMSLSGGIARLDHGQPVGVVDLTNPAAKQWWQGRLRGLLRMGAAALRLGDGDRLPEDALFCNGKTGLEMHNLYPHLYAEAAFEAARQVHGEGMLWRGAGYIGTQRYGSGCAGDTQVSWRGMRNALRGGLSAGFTGEAFWGHDIGGCVGDRPTPELYIRWAQFGLLSPLARFHGSTPREPWLYGEPALAIVRRYAQLRYALIPYLRAAAAEAVAEGLPLLRHMYLEFPDEPNVDTIDDQYMLGADLLVAPVLREGARSRPVYFPRGRWYRLDDPSDAVEGGRFLEVAAPLDRIPAYARAGAVIPRYLAAPQHLKGPAATTLALEIYPGERRRHLSFDEGARVEIEYACSGGAARLSIGAAPLGFVLRLVGWSAEARGADGAPILAGPAGEIALDAARGAAVTLERRISSGP